MGLTWALAWFGAGLLLLLVVGTGAADVPFPIGFGLLGFLAGVVFSGVLSVTENRRHFDQMRMGRFAGWGAVGGLLFAGMFAFVATLAGEPLELLVVGPVLALAGAGSAAGSLALARRRKPVDCQHHVGYCPGDDPGSMPWSVLGRSSSVTGAAGVGRLAREWPCDAAPEPASPSALQLSSACSAGRRHPPCVRAGGEVP